MSPQCHNCGAHVTSDYVRVMSPTGADGVRTCPKCPRVRNGGEIRQARSTGNYENAGVTQK